MSEKEYIQQLRKRAHARRQSISRDIVADTLDELADILDKEIEVDLIPLRPKQYE